MKTQRKDTHTGPKSSQTDNGATNPVRIPVLDQEAIAVLAYYYWEARGCPHDSPHEDWFRAEAELHGQMGTEPR